MSLSSTSSQLLTYVSVRQRVVAMAESVYMPLSAGLLCGVFIS
jgi:hypothetical protein